MAKQNTTPCFGVSLAIEIDPAAQDKQGKMHEGVLSVIPHDEEALAHSGDQVLNRFAELAELCRTGGLRKLELQLGSSKDDPLTQEEVVASLVQVLPKGRPCAKLAHMVSSPHQKRSRQLSATPSSSSLPGWAPAPVTLKRYMETWEVVSPAFEHAPCSAPTFYAKSNPVVDIDRDVLSEVSSSAVNSDTTDKTYVRSEDANAQVVAQETEGLEQEAAWEEDDDIPELCITSQRKRRKRAGKNRSYTKSFTCHECGYETICVTNLKRHIRFHTGEKPFKCDTCSYECTLSWALKRHMRTHTGEKPFKCTICDYRCSLSWALKRHMRTHKSPRFVGLSTRRLGLTITELCDVTGAVSFLSSLTTDVFRQGSANVLNVYTALVFCIATVQ
eukprot:g37178.t1